MFKKSLNKYTRSLYQNINKKIYIISFVIALILVIWTIISNLFGKKEETNVTPNTSLYKPAETVISGKDIKESVYEEEENLINTFIDYASCDYNTVSNAVNNFKDVNEEVFSKVINKCYKEKKN